ncbi:MAG: polyhydroxyalkanoate synthesis repressor PhaR [Pacificimonas sp.]
MATSGKKPRGRKRAAADDDGVVVIKKYANRRLYNTATSSYITLDHLGVMTREGTDFKVIDAKSGDNITRAVLTQIIMDEETHGQTMLPTSFLKEIISLYGNQMQAMVPSYLEASMAALRRNQEQFTRSMMGATNPFSEIARQNMKMFEAAIGGTPTETASPKEEVEEIDALKAELAAMKAKLDRLG